MKQNTLEALTNKKSNFFDVNVDKIQDVFLLLYFCIWNTYTSLTPLNSVLRKTSFILCILSAFLSITRTKTLAINGYIKWVTLFLLYNCMSLLWTSSFEDSYIYINAIIKILIISVCISLRIKTVNDINKIIKIFVFSVFYMCVCLIVMSPASDWGTNQIGSVLGLWKNTVGMESSVGAVLAIYLISISESVKEKIFHIIESVLLTFITFFSGSRKAFVLIMAACIIVFLINSEKNLNYKKIIQRLFIGVTLIMLVIAGVLLINKNKLLYDLVGFRLYEAYQSITNPMYKVTDPSIIEREFFIGQAQQLFMEHPIFGYGANTFLTYMRQIGYSHIAYSHNNFWELLSTLGIVGFSIHYFMQVYLLIRLYPKKYEEKEMKKLVAFLWVLNLFILILGYWFVYSYNQFYYLILIISFKCNRQNGKTILLRF